MSRNKIYTLAIIALTLCACARDDREEPGSSQSSVIMIDFGNSGINVWQSSATRDAGHPDIDADKIHSVGVFALNEVDANLLFDNQAFYNKTSDLFPDTPELTELKSTWAVDNDWVYTPQKMWLSNKDYLFLAYAPYSAGNVSVSREGNDFTSLRWDGISSISASDHLISTCAPYTSLSSNNPAMPLTLTHLMARLRFCFKLSEDYADLRTIVAKQMKVNYAESRLMQLNVTIAKEGSTYKSSYRWERESHGTGITSVQLANEPGIAGISLTKGVDYQALASLYYEPGDPINIVEIDVTYDVYDKTGQLLRENDLALSTISMPRTFEPGKYYDIKIKIEPSYLYILSDREPDTDGELVIP